MIKEKINRFLIWSQKYTQTDNIYLARSSFWLTLERTVSMAASFLLALAFANLLPKAVYGTYAYILSLIGLLGVFSLSGIWMAVIQGTARGLEGSFYTGFKTKLKWGTLGSLAALLGAAYYWFRGNDTLPIPLLITAIFLPLMMASRIYGGFLAGRKLFNVGSKYGMIGTIISVGAMIITILLTDNLLWLVAVYLVSHTFLNYFFYLRVKTKLRPNKKEDPKTIPYGKHLSFIGIIGRVAKELDKVIMFAFVGPVEVAVYSFALSIPTQVNSLLSNIASIYIPKLATKSREEIRASLMKKIWRLFILMAAITIIYIVAAPIFYKIFFPKYIDSVPYSQLLALSFMLLPLSWLSNIFRAKMLKKDLYLARMVEIIKLVLLLVLIPLFGILGAVLALLGFRVLQAIVIMYLSILYLRKD